MYFSRHMDIHVNKRCVLQAEPRMISLVMIKNILCVNERQKKEIIMCIRAVLSKSLLFCLQLNYGFSLHSISICSCTVRFQSELVNNLKYIFSRSEAHFRHCRVIRMYDKKVIQQCLVKYGILFALVFVLQKTAMVSQSRVQYSFLQEEYLCK